MKSNIFIRQVKPSDLATISGLAMRSKASWGYPDDFMERCRAELEVTEAKLKNMAFSYHLAEEGSSDIVGFYALKRVDSSTVELEALFVEPAHFGKGIGRMLFDHAVTLARHMEAKTMLIQSDPYAGPFYIAMGATPAGERESESIKGRFLPLYKVELKVK